MTEFPSEKDLRKLPLRAVVAYAARNARRVQPLFQQAADIRNHKKHSHSIETAIELSELRANGESLKDLGPIDTPIIFHPIDPPFGYIVHCITTSANAAARSTNNTASSNAARTAARASSTVADADRVAGRATARTAVRTAKNTFYATNEKADTDVTSAAYADYQKLLSMNLSTEDSIDASENGPLGPYWPEELEPDWYKELYPQMRALLDEPLEE